jgi:Sporulation and spore germination
MVLLSHLIATGRSLRGGVRRKYLGRPSRRKLPDVRSPRLLVLVALLAIVAAGTWFYLSHGVPRTPETLAVYYTKLDGTSLAQMRVSLRPREPGESAAEHLHNTALYAAVQAVAGPPNDVPAIRFPPGTRVLGVTVDANTATIDLSKEVERQAGGSFGENGEFKALVYTLTGIAGIGAVQVLVEGSRLAMLPGGHLELDQPLARADW